MSGITVLIWMLGAAVLGFLLAFSWMYNQSADLKNKLEERHQLLAYHRGQQAELMDQLNGLAAEKLSFNKQLKKLHSKLDEAHQKNQQLEKEKAFIIKEFHELKSMATGESEAMQSYHEQLLQKVGKLEEEKQDNELVLEELKKSIVLLNNQLNTLRNKTRLKDIK
ncbi:MAG: hypothetical protein AAFP19_03225 [Bacteroidota bacterium]